MKKEIPLNYRLYRYACIVFSMFIIMSFLPQLDEYFIPVSEIAMYLIFIIIVIAFISEASGWFEKSEKEEK